MQISCCYVKQCDLQHMWDTVPYDNRQQLLITRDSPAVQCCAVQCIVRPSCPCPGGSPLTHTEAVHGQQHQWHRIQSTLHGISTQAANLVSRIVIQQHCTTAQTQLGGGGPSALSASGARAGPLVEYQALRWLCSVLA